MNRKEIHKFYKYSQGLDAWHIASKKHPNRKLTLNDGPCGIRKPIGQGFIDQSGVEEALCCLAPSAIAASFDEKVAYKNGLILGNECAIKKVDILLAPGVNIKRNVLCGRNFEYFSEDPLLSGILSGNYIKGIEKNGTGTCIKHFCANNRESYRLISSSEISLRALNEIYIRSFYYALKVHKPFSLMTSYNRVNGEYVNESKYLFERIKKDLNYHGLIISDWGAVDNKANCFKNGLDIEMPISTREPKYLDSFLKQKIFTIKDLVRNDNHVDKCISKKKVSKLDLNLFKKSHEELIKLSNETPILLKNENNYFPLKKEEKVLYIGYLVNHNHFVGEGSAFVNAYDKRTFLDFIKEEKINFKFIEGYNERDCNLKESDLIQYKGKVDKVVLFMGQYQKDEREGYDRSNIELKLEQKKTLDIVSKVFKNFGVVFISGSVVNLEPVYKKSSSILLSYLNGEAQKEGIFNNLYGIHNPCGRLPESWISNIDENPIYKKLLKREVNFDFYDDDIFVGYRYYQKNHKSFVLPFGFGLSYSMFRKEIEDIKLLKNKILLNVKISNVGNFDGNDIIQIYVSKKDSMFLRPKYELKAFKKVFLKIGSTKTISISIPLDNLKIYSEKDKKFILENGEYDFHIGNDSFDILKGKVLNLKGISFKERQVSIVPEYKEIKFEVDMNTPFEYFLNKRYDLFKKNFEECKSENLKDLFERMKKEPEQPFRFLSIISKIPYSKLININLKYKN